MSENKQELSLKAKKSIFGILSLVVILYFVFSSKDESPISDHDPMFNNVVFEGPKILMGKWMGSSAGCLSNYTPSSTRTFTLGQGYIQASSKPTKQEMVVKYLPEQEVHSELKKHLNNCSNNKVINEPVWFSLTLLRPVGDKVLFWYGEETDELPELASGYLFDVTMNGITMFEKFDLAKVKPNKVQ